MKMNKIKKSSKKHLIYSGNLIPYKTISHQTIKITYYRELSSLPVVFIDDKAICAREIDQLALNAGFNSAVEFYQHFNNDFEGLILHWTKLRYAE